MAAKVKGEDRTVRLGQIGLGGSSPDLEGGIPSFRGVRPGIQVNARAKDAIERRMPWEGSRSAQTWVPFSSILLSRIADSIGPHRHL